MHPIPQYLDDFNTNYIIFRNAEIFNNCFLQKQIVKQIEESFEIFWKYSIFRMESLKLINYSADMCWSCPC